MLDIKTLLPKRTNITEKQNSKYQKGTISVPFFLAIFRVICYTNMNNIRVTVVIRTCPKASFFSAFRRFGFERRQPVGTLNNQKSSENPQLSGRRFFIERIFGNSRQKHSKSFRICEYFNKEVAEIIR